MGQIMPPGVPTLLEMLTRLARARDSDDINPWAKFDWSYSKKSREPLICWAFSESPSMNDTESVVSDPLEKYTTEEELWQALIKWRREPLKEPDCLEVETWEEEDGTLVCRKTYKQEWDSGVAQEGVTPCRVYKTVIDHENKTMARSVYYSDGKTVAASTDHIVIHRDPLVLEVWRTHPLGMRDSGAHIAHLSMLVLANILAETARPESPPDYDVLDRVPQGFFEGYAKAFYSSFAP
mmetsp:Transcript_104114/g.212431  ORF Transcript_104114/g.212431 Transcript_104114/m.212431 type:complete len:237 (-) Transcript_104114:81-791(-)